MNFTQFHLNEQDRLYPNGRIEYVCNNECVEYCAFEKNDNVSVRVFLPRALGTTSASLEIFYESCKKLYKRIPLLWTEISSCDDVYTVDLLDFRVGLYFYRIVLENGQGRVYGVGSNECISFSFKEEESLPCIQLSVSDFEYAAPKDEYGGIIYHIFVDRFAKGGNYPPKEGAVVGLDYSLGIPEYPEYPGAPLKNNTFWGGTLTGISEKLDYLSGLGVTLIYLSPIFESQSNHKYDTADYMTVDSMFGGESALCDLIQKAKEKGIGIILDGVFNHTGSDSIYFNRYGRYPTLGAYQSTDSPYYSWYEFQSHPDKYTCWWGIDILPRIRPEEKSLCEFITGPNGVIEKYRKLGVRGFRLDVVDELSDSFVAKIKSALTPSADKPSILYGEVWEDASNKIAYSTRKKYYLGRELDGVMNYPIRTGIISYLTSGDTSKLKYALVDVLRNTPLRILNMQMNLLGSHDTERAITMLAGPDGSSFTNAQLQSLRLTNEERMLGQKRLCMAYTILATIPGIPSIYYGDESGLEGYRDPFNRMPFPWDNIDEFIQNHYIKIGQIRRSNKVYADGKFKILHLNSELFAFLRTDGKHSFVTIINNSHTRLCVSSSRKHLNMFDDKSRLDSYLPAFSSLIIRIPHDTTLEFIFDTKEN